MIRYQKANRGIHAPAGLKKRAAGTARPARPRLWIAAAAAVLAVAVISGAVLWPGGGVLAPAARAASIARADYPKCAPYPGDSQAGYDAWSQERAARREAGRQLGDLSGFYSATMAQFLTDSGGRNVVYSPLNAYLALAMLAELTGGDSRAQILELLGVSDLDSLRAQVSALWTANYVDDGAVTSILASSLWLNENVTFVQDTMDRLADTYYASSYRGQMGSPELDQALRAWLNEQTGGLLEDYAEEIQLSADTVLALASTLYFRAKWDGEFWQENNTRQPFHSPSGDVTAEFMNQQLNSSYYWADQFSAVGKRFKLGGAMWFLLPDEGVSVDDLLSGGQVAEFLSALYDWESQRDLIVNFSMPKFDVSSQLDLISGLKELGVTDVFDAGVSDFTPMTQAMEEIYVSQITHAARVNVDERGCEAAAFTVIATEPGAAAPPDEEVDFVLDRPFLFAVTGGTGQLLFVGVVNQPAQ